ncbi:TPA: restriction endonuclease subunit S [Streptococcus pyogenes]|uniref:restriction endonuclease subunit S n=4 Tax=Streptococcus pyogenes TaxID=1314 RepID=UPI0004592AF9|nr:restriction endonuclease subunit S [Streptococcus pyogenes]HER4537747.1 restriction endonuclease subunit S [Streptococcus pyogenes NGAS673]HER4549882.1 restriction endonuclease subunit S [Streptococcus pyogenes NGAS660]HER4558510.1 restriction endonuclease subunit S [Streptococcus pyogenes NGAS672]HER4560082.1 restriction endonuclease subunit S [Streptococcus pyogenes NGAS663]HER4627737.1 restriction endonuclease subunit S [Streptococcus pyogenes NGAS549]HER4631247.1 restriction endonuclea
MTKSKQPQYRFDGFEGEWEEKRISDIANVFTGGGTPSTQNDQYWTGNIPWIQSSDLSKDEILDVNPKKFITKLGLSNSAAKLIPKNSIAIVTRVGVGKLSIINREYTTSQDFLSISDLKENLKFTVYSLYRLLQKELNQLQGTSIKGITKGYLLSKTILIPSLPEQGAIGELFQMVDQLIQLQDQKLATLKEQKQTFLRKMFPAQGQKVPEIRLQGFKGEWEEKKLGEVSTHRSGTAIEKYFDSEGEFKVISIGSYGTNNLYVDQNIRAVSNELTNSKLVASGELTMVLNDKTANGAIIGRCLLITENNKYVVNQRTEIIRPDINISSYYLFHYLNGEFRNGIIKIAQGGTQIYVNYSSVEQLKINIPTLKEQEAIGNFFQTLDQQIAQSEEKLTELKALKQTLLNRLFV